MHGRAYTLNFLKGPNDKVFSVLGCVPLLDAVVHVGKTECFLCLSGCVSKHLCCEARGAREFVFPHTSEGGSEFTWRDCVHCASEVWVYSLCFYVIEDRAKSARHFGSEASREVSVMKEGTGMRLGKKVVEMRLVASSLALVESEETAPVSWSMVL